MYITVIKFFRLCFCWYFGFMLFHTSEGLHEQESWIRSLY